MKRIVFPIALICIAVNVQAATIYVTTGNANPTTQICYKSGAWPAAACADGTDDSDIEAAMTAAGTNGTVILDGGTTGITYSDSQLDSDNSLHDVADNLTVKGSTETGRNGLVTLVSTSANTFLNYDYGSFSVQNMKIVGPAGYWAFYGGTTTSMSDVTIEAAGMGLMLGSGAGGNVITRTKVKAAAGEFSIRLNSSSTISNSIFEPQGTPVWISGGNHVISNSIFTGGKNGTNYSATAIVSPTDYTGTALCKDCIFTANTVDGPADQYVVDNQSLSGGTITLTNPLFVQSPRGKGVSAGVTINGTPVYADPRFVSTRRPSYASIAVDDGVNFSVAQSLSAVAPVTFFIDNYISDTSEPTWASIGTFINAGNEIGGHTFCGAQLTGLNAVTFSSTGTVPTVEITSDQTNSNPFYWTATIVLKENGSSINGAGYTAASYYTLAALKSKIETTHAGWTVTITGTAGGGCRTALLHQETKSAAGTPDPFTFENNLVGSSPVQRFWYHEVVYQKKLVEDKLATVLGSAYIMRTFAYPGGEFNSTLETFLATQSNYDPLSVTKYIGARTAGATSPASWTLSDDYVSGSGSAAGLQVYELLAPNMATDIGTTNPDRFAVAWGQWATYAGGYFIFYTHAAAGYSDANAKAFIAGLRQNHSLTLLTVGDMLTKVRTSGLWTDADADGKRWTRTYTNAQDYRLAPGSPAVGAGTACAATASDFLQTPVCSDSTFVAKGSARSIGPYQNPFPARTINGRVMPGGVR